MDNSVLDEIKTICLSYGATQIILFGSRAKGTNMLRSDFDIAVRGIADSGHLQSEIENINTLYTIDMVYMDRCKNDNLLEEISKYGVQI
ncbi:hypothetical protein FACS1894111_11070 [Clostridia bacterium]|nr:hypothetical protein FACS1894111_11070 [Clostridia bacterium]